VAKNNGLGLAMVAFSMGIVPLIVRLDISPIEGQRFEFWTGRATSLDFFSFYRLVWLSIAVSVGFIARIWRRSEISGACSGAFSGMLGVYALLAGLSTVFSEYPIDSLIGGVEKHEGAIALFSYLGLSFLALNAVESEKHARFIILTLFSSGIVIGVISAFQSFGFDLFQSDFGKFLILPERFFHHAATLEFFVGQGQSYGTFPNSNNLGSYSAIMVVLTFGCLLFQKGWPRVLSVSLNLLFFLTLIGSRSRAGMLGVTCGCLMLLFVALRMWKKFAPALILMAFLLPFITFAADYFSLKNAGFMRIIDNRYSVDGVVGAPDLGWFESLSLGSESFTLVFSDSRFRVEKVGQKVSFLDEANKRVPYRITDGKVIFPKGAFSGFEVRVLPKEQIIHVRRSNFSARFIYWDGFKILDHRGRPCSQPQYQKWPFEGYERFANCRGYVWSRSLPLLEKALLIGFGPELFGFYFPNDELVGKLKAVGKVGWWIDKPHNMYLQIAVSTGVLSLIVFLLIIGTYLWDSVRLFFRASFESFTEQIGLAISMSVLAYLVAGCFNDSVVAVAPVFWGLLGTGIAVNRMIREADRQHLLAASESDTMHEITKKTEITTKKDTVARDYQ